MVAKMQKETKPISNFYNISVLWDATKCNPNGDRSDNRPRTNYLTEKAEISAPAFKGRIRDAWVHLYGRRTGDNVFYRAENGELLEDRNEDLSKNASKAKKDALQMACEEFLDIRSFGGVLAAGKGSGKDLGNITGIVSMNIVSETIDKVLVRELELTRQMRSKSGKKDGETGTTKGSQFGSHYFIDYGLFKTDMGLWPYRANVTGFSDADVVKLVRGIQHMWLYAQTTSKNGMQFLKMWIFKHPSNLPAIPPAAFNNLVTVKPFGKRGEDVFPESFNDYGKDAIQVNMELIKKNNIEVFTLDANDNYLQDIPELPFNKA